MSGHSKTQRFGIFGKLTLALFLLLLIAAPAFGQVKSARAKVLSRVDDIITTRKANFQPGDILGTPLISVTVNNGAGAAHLLLTLRIEFGGTWDEDYVQVSLVKKIEANAAFTFTNTDMLSYIGNIRTNDFSMSDTLLEHTGVTGVSDIANLRNMPEGTYKIVLTADEITLSDPDDINSSYTVVKEWVKETTAGATVEFKVVTIGSIGGITLPTFDNLSLRFQVPEIPVYSDSTSRTKIVINGPGVANYTATKNHLKSASSSGFKGYPSDTDGGFVTYDLSAVPFRAGESYSVVITFIDWNGADITSKTSSISFPTPNLNEPAPNVTDPYLPILSWNFSGADYSDWVKEYRVYLNGRYVGKTSEQEYQLSDLLLPNTAYTWYVMPHNKDDSPFFASSAGLVKSFTTKAHTDLAVQIDEPRNNSILIKGESYAFGGTATFSDGASESAATWQIGTESKNGMDISYIPSRRYAANSLSAWLKVTDSLGLSRNSTTIYLTVLEPAIAVQGNAARSVDKGVPVVFALDSQNTRDLASYEWFMDGGSIGAGIQKTYTFAESGTHEVYVAGTTVADINGTTKTVQSAKVSVTVAGAAPVVSITQPASGGELVLGTSVRIVAGIVNENRLSSTVWSVVGPDTSQNGATGGELLFKPASAGLYTATVTVTDIYQKTAKAEVRILVIDPAIAITSPAQNAVFSLTSTLTPAISAPNADRIVWYIGGNEISGSSYALSQLGVGSFELYATAFWNSIDLNGNPAEYSESSPRVAFSVRDLNPPQISIGFPQNAMVLKTGETYRFNATVSSSSAISESWWLVDGTRLSSNTYSPPVGTTRKLLSISHKARNADGIEGTATVSVRLINPSVFLSPPPATEYPVGTVIPVNGSAVDAGFAWVVDGEVIENWNKIFAQAGAHSIQGRWSAEAVDGGGSNREFSGLSNAVALTIYSNQAPAVTSYAPANSLIREAVGRSIDFSMAASGENAIQAVTWRVLNNGSLVREASGNTLSQAFAAAGQYTVRALVTDVRGLTASREWTVKIISPSIGITYPTSGMAFGMGAVPTPVVATQDLNSYTLALDGLAVGINYNWSGTAQGTHTLTAEGFYEVSSQPTPQRIVSSPVTFNVENRTPPSFTIEGIKDGDRIIAGQPYTFTVRRNGSETIQWFRNGALVPGASLQYPYVPVAGEGETSFAVRGTLNNITAEKTFKVKVIDPYVSMVLPEAMAYNGLFPSQTPIPLQSERRDLDRIEWRVDSQPYAGQTVSLEPGNHTISVRGFATGVRLPNSSYGEFEPVGRGVASRDIAVSGRLTISGLTVSPSTPYTTDRVTISVATEGNVNILSSFIYRMDGLVLGQGRTPSMVVPNLASGQHLLSVTVLDVFGKSSTRELPVTVHVPLALSIAQPANDARISPDTNILASISVGSGQYSSISWAVDGTTVPNSNFATGSLGRLAPGAHTISVNASDPLGKVVSASVRVEVQSDFQLSLMAPAAGTEIIVGTTTTAMVALDRVAGSQVDLTDAAQNISWLVNGGDTGRKGLTFQFTGATAGEQTIQARYQKGDMVRTTIERRISVRDIATPTINKPFNGETITYAAGGSIALSATGEPGATFSWIVDGLVVAMGGETVWNPSGLAGQKQLKLLTSVYGRAKEKLVTVNLVVNSPPVLSLTAPRIQYTGENLAWTASVFDAEDQNAPPAVEIFLDGVKLATGAPRLLGQNDIGRHTLSAKTTDANGSTVTQQVEVVVESSQLAIAIQSPIAGKTYFKEYDLQLMASLAASGGDASGTGTFNWTVQYLDDTTVQPDQFTGSSAVFRPKALGDLAISARFVDGTGRDRGTQKLNIRVEREPLQLGIYWPHGSVVNAGDPLTPGILGLPAAASTGTLTWALNGRTIEAIASLRAPDAPGQYTLTAQYLQNGSADRAELNFTVNGRPAVTITNLIEGGQYILGNPVILSARVEDDQPYAGTITWKKQDGTPIGAGNPFVLRDASPGEWKIVGTAVDNYGAEASSTVSILFYRPAANFQATVNNGLATYLIAEGAGPLRGILSFEGGIAPQAAWTLRQGDRTLTNSGGEASFAYGELAPFAEAAAVLTASVVDAGLANVAAREVFRRDYPIELARNAVAELKAPLAGQLYWVGEPVPVNVALTGFTSPLFSMKVNGADVPGEWAQLQGTGLYGSQIPAALLQAEGVYELGIAVSENGTVRVIPFTLNVYQKRSGIFIDNPPAAIDLETGGAGRVEAVVVGLEGIDATRWRTDLSATPVGSGLTLDLAAAGLTPGNRSIMVDALSGSRVVSTATFPLKVYGPMELAVEPASDPLILQRGADVRMEALARDRDGSALTGGAITWTSHIDGVLGNGASLALGDLAELSAGEHVLTVAAKGANGAVISVLKRIQVNVAAGDTGGQGGDDEGQGGDQGGAGGPPPAFGPGNRIPGPGGRGGTPPPAGNGMPADIVDVMVYFAELRQTLEERLDSAQLSPPQRTRVTSLLMQVTLAVRRTESLWQTYRQGQQTPQDLARVRREILQLRDRIKQMEIR